MSVAAGLPALLVAVAVPQVSVSAEADPRLDVRLDGTPAWVLAVPDRSGDAWVVALRSGELVVIELATDPGMVERRHVGAIPAGTRPRVTGVSDGRPVVVASRPGRTDVDAIPHARLGVGPDGIDAVLTGPTRRYPHGVLGDDVEATSVTVWHPDGRSNRIEVGANEVIEGISPLLADIDGDGVSEVIVTVSDIDEGSRLRAYRPDGAHVADSEPVGRGYRWRHQIGVGPTGPDGEIEIIAVRTPHIGGIIEAFRLADGRLQLVARQPGYRSHQLGSSNLEMAMLADVDRNERLDVIVPTQDMRTLAVLTRSADGFELIDSLPLDGNLATNVAGIRDGAGQLVLAAGTDDGWLRVFRTDPG